MHERATPTAVERHRYDFKRMLDDRGRTLEREVRRSMREARNDSTRDRAGFDEGEAQEVDIQTEIDFSLLEIKVETLNAIDLAVRRIGEGTYGTCVECDNTIPDARLRALPFAVRCKGCEELREMSARANHVQGFGDSLPSSPTRA